MLDDLARQAGIAAHLVELHTELRHARARSATLSFAMESWNVLTLEVVDDGCGPPAQIYADARRGQPDTSVLIPTMFEDDASVIAAVRAGARGYLLNGAAGEETVRAIRAVSEGEAIFSPSVAKRLIQYFSAPPVGKAPLFPELTDREREGLQFIAQGYTNAAIAERLTLSPKTVRNRVSNASSKL